MIKIKNKFQDVVTEIRADLSRSLQEIKDDVVNYGDLVKSHDLSYKSKFVELEYQNHILQHRLNRGDILMSGLSDNLEKLDDTAVYMCAFFKVDISPGCVDHVMYVNYRISILIKFNNVLKRDKVMAAYFKTKSLKVSDVIGGSNLANNLFNICWKF